jgi:glutaredoxin-like YruB-family protein
MVTGMVVVVYSTPSCPYCKMAKDFLLKHNIPFKDINVAVDRIAALEMIRKSGQMGVPVIDIDGKIIVGFDKEEIKKALRIND